MFLFIIRKVNECLFYYLCSRNIFAIVKSLDEQKEKAHVVAELFSEDFQQKRKKLVDLCQRLLFSDFDNASGLGKKARDILWRKGYYDLISKAKCTFAKTKITDPMIEKVIYEGISVFKNIILKLESELNLDLNYTIDMTIIKDLPSKPFLSTQEDKNHTMMEISFAWDLIHASLISIGDLYRYILALDLSPETITDDVAAAYYQQAFKLNPNIGMAQNQLGTLYAGKNYEIDSIFHYLYALLCRTSFQLSESNVNKIFKKNAMFLESMNGNSIDADDKIIYFIARFILVVDIFFFDKEVTDFTDLCHSILIDMKYLLDGSDQGFLTQGILFKMTSILLFCLHRLKLNKSKKVHSMNALLVALTSELVEKCTTSVMQFISVKEAQNIIFYDKYNRVFTKFEEFVRDDLKKKQAKEVEKLCPKVIRSKNESIEAVTYIETGFDDKRSLSNKENKVEMKKSIKRSVRHRRRRPQLSNCTETDISDLDELLDDSDTDDSFSSYNDDSSVNSDCSIEIDEDELVPQSSGSDPESDSGDDIIVLGEEVIYPSNDENGDAVQSDAFIDKDVNYLSDLVVKFEELRGGKYRSAYCKVDPNIIIEFCAKEKCLKALKILFDWIYLNPDIVVGCYVSNPEFIHKIMRLINYLNIDIFTRKIYFDQCFITHPDLRPNLRYLFDIRRTIAIEEEEQLKRFSMFDNVQQSIDWELSRKIQVTHNEMVFLRLFKLIDFGFHLSKMRKFHYYFCAKDRIFIERNKKRSDQCDQNLKRKRHNRNRRERQPKTSKERNMRRHRNRRRKEQDIKLQTPTIAKRNNYDQNSGDEAVKSSEVYISNGIEGKSTSEKMAALWLHNEVSSLENKVFKTIVSPIVICV